jgi:hypothetical protein
LVDLVQEVNWLEIAAIIILLLGIGAGGFLVAQRPSFWLGLITVTIKAAIPAILKRNPPDVEERMNDCIRSGGQWDNFRKRCKR